MAKKIRKRYIIANKDGDWSIWKTAKDARLGVKDTDYNKGWIDTICDIQDHIGFTPSKTKVTEISFRTLK